MVGTGLHAFDGDGVKGRVDWINNVGVIDNWLRNCRSRRGCGRRSGGRGDGLNGGTNPLFATRHVATDHNDRLLIDANGHPCAKCCLCARLPYGHGMCRRRWNRCPYQDGAEGNENFFHCLHISE